MARPRYKDKKYRESSIAAFIEGVKDSDEVTFLKQFDYDPRNRIAFIYNEGNSDTFRAVLELSKYAEKHCKISNLCKNDMTIRYITVFDKSAGTYADYIGLMNYALSQCGCRQFLDAFCGIKEKQIFINNKKYIRISDLSTEKQFLYGHVYPSLQKIEEDTSIFLGQKCGMNQSLYRNTYRKLLENLEIDKELYIRWKSEYSMYSLIKCYYTDAVFQYRDVWLGQQSLDVFVPCIKTGFEYQGVQHYEPVEFFGGEDNFRQRVELDRRKKEKCNEKKVNLVEWRFDEPIDRLTLEQKLKNYQITLSPRRNELFSSQNHADFKLDNIVHTRRQGNSASLLNDAIETKNIEQIYNILMDLIQKKNNSMVQNALLKMKETFSYREMLSLYMVICDREKFYRSFIRLIVHNEELLNYYISSHYCNYYTRKIILYLIKTESDEEKVIEKINMMKKACTSHHSLSYFKNHMQCAVNEAGENNVDRNKVIQVLKKAKIIRSNAVL